jgi:hypothetical protein
MDEWIDAYDGFKQRWLDVITGPVDQTAVIATLSALYQKAGYAAPEVVFLDSPWATAIAPCAVFQKPAADLETQARTALLNLRQELNNQLFGQLWQQCDDCKACQFMLHFLSFAFMTTVERYPGWRGEAAWLAVLSQYDEWQSGFANSIRYTFPTDVPVGLVTLEDFSYPWISFYHYYADWSWMATDPTIEQVYEQLGDRLFDQFCFQIHPYNQQDIEFVKPIWYEPTVNAVFYEYAAEFGIELDPELRELFHCSPLYDVVLNPFPDICFVSDRPQIKRDHLDRLHAEAEPAIQFADGSGEYFHHGSRLPPNYGSVSPSQWQAEWVIQEPNAHLRSILIREIGYPRLCQELVAEAINSWREYTLLRLPFQDDYDNAWALNPVVNPVYVLKMTCSSTGLVYFIRVPPEMTSARAAASWVNLGIDPVSFAVET